MKLIVVGSSPAWPNPGGAQSGYLVVGSGRLLLDCGAGVLAAMREREPWPIVDAIAITHFHLDHWGDLVPWVWGSVYGPGREAEPPELWLPPGGADFLSLLGGRLGSEDMFERAFVIDEYDERAPFPAAGFEVTALRVPHYDMEAYAFRVVGPDRTLAYSGDSGPSDRLAEIARDADLFLCEATIGESNPDRELRGHLSIAEAEEAFAASGAKRLLLTHRPSELGRDGGLEFVRDGYELEL